MKLYRDSTHPACMNSIIVVLDHETYDYIDFESKRRTRGTYDHTIHTWLMGWKYKYISDSKMNVYI